MKNRVKEVYESKGLDVYDVAKILRDDVKVGISRTRLVAILNCITDGYVDKWYPHGKGGGASLGHLNGIRKEYLSFWQISKALNCTIKDLMP